MASNDKGAGPQLGQIVLYNNAGSIIPGIIDGVNANGTVNICSFSPGSAGTDRASVGYDPNLGASKWAYPQFF